MPATTPTIPIIPGIPEIPDSKAFLSQNFPSHPATVENRNPPPVYIPHIYSRRISGAPSRTPHPASRIPHPASRFQNSTKRSPHHVRMGPIHTHCRPSGNTFPTIPIIPEIPDNPRFKSLPACYESRYTSRDTKKKPLLRGASSLFAKLYSNLEIRICSSGKRSRNHLRW